MRRVGERLYPSGSLPESLTVHAGAGWALVFAIERPARAEVAAVARGRVEVAVDLEGPALVWLARASLAEPSSEAPRSRARHRTGARSGPLARARACTPLAWSACALAWWERTAPDLPPDAPGVAGIVQVVIADARSTRIAAVRTIGLTPAVAAQVRAIEGEAQRAGRDEDALEAVRRWTREAREPEVAARADAALARTSVQAR